MRRAKPSRFDGILNAFLDQHETDPNRRALLLAGMRTQSGWQTAVEQCEAGASDRVVSGQLHCAMLSVAHAMKGLANG